VKKHLIKDQKTELVVGVLTLVLAYRLLYDATTGRGESKPMAIRPFTPW
jgi:hypothetical protein